MYPTLAGIRSMRPPFRRRDRATAVCSFPLNKRNFWDGKLVWAEDGSALVWLLMAMHFLVTCCAERDQVLLGIVPGLASMLFMVDLKVRPCAACLASPAVPSQDL